MKTLKNIVDELMGELEHWRKALVIARKQCEHPANPNDQWYHEKIKALAINRIETIESMVAAYGRNNAKLSDI